MIYLLPKRPGRICRPPSLILIWYWDSFLRVQGLGRDVDHSSQLRAKLRMNGAVQLLPLYVFMAWIMTLAAGQIHVRANQISFACHFGQETNTFRTSGLKLS
jgi:hypothetical protein